MRHGLLRMKINWGKGTAFALSTALIATSAITPLSAQKKKAQTEEEPMAWAEPAAPAVETLPPRDECSSYSPAHAAFLNRLRAISASRDEKGLIAMMDKNILVDFGGSAGVKDFRNAWELPQKGKNSPLWDELATILTLGCGMSTGGDGVTAEAVIPLVTASTDMPDDPFMAHIALGSVPLRLQPKDNAKIIAQLNWDILDRTGLEGDESEDSEWFRVRRVNGQTGYVRIDQTRSPIDYRMHIEDKNGVLKITAFIAGD